MKQTVGLKKKSYSDNEDNQLVVNCSVLSPRGRWNMARKLSLSLCPRGKFQRNRTGGGPHEPRLSTAQISPRGAGNRSVRQISMFKKSPSAIEASRNSFPRTTAHVAGGRSRTSSGYWSLAGAASCPRRLTAMRDARYTEQVHLIRVTCRNGQSWIFLSCSINFLPLPIRIDDHEKQI
jgi:hypothetical protein